MAEFQTRSLKSPNGVLEAIFAPRAGMVGCSLRYRGIELLHVGGGLSEYIGRGTTFGIPLLYPWANRLAGFDYTALGKHVRLEHRSALVPLDQNGLPIHGLIAASPYWEAERPRVGSPGALSAALDFGAYPALVKAFPYPHSLHMRVLLTDEELQIATTVTADRGTPVPISFGFHPYLRLPGARRHTWQIEMPVKERLVLDDNMIPTGEREPVDALDGPLGDRAFDDAYAGVNPEHPFSVSGAGLRLEVRFNEGFPFAQVYSPPGAEFICFEPMTAPTNALRSGNDLPVVDASESFTAIWTIAISAEG
jgi:galactose mutarotase-like enzyme